MRQERLAGLEDGCTFEAYLLPGDGGRCRIAHLPPRDDGRVGLGRLNSRTEDD
jgi:hypothetical protein